MQISALLTPHLFYSLGLEGSGSESTFWFGSAGSQTACHYDTYGVNYVAQVLSLLFCPTPEITPRSYTTTQLWGTKQWRLFAPTNNGLYPTRIPYEESSVYSQVNVASPDFDMNPRFRDMVHHIVTLTPGDILFVPRHWWHHVTTLSPSMAVNLIFNRETLSRTKAKKISPLSFVTLA